MVSGRVPRTSCCPILPSCDPSTESIGRPSETKRATARCVTPSEAVRTSWTGTACPSTCSVREFISTASMGGRIFRNQLPKSEKGRSERATTRWIGVREVGSVIFCSVISKTPSFLPAGIEVYAPATEGARRTSSG